jgi:hypothetical protein
MNDFSAADIDRREPMRVRQPLYRPLFCAALSTAALGGGELTACFALVAGLLLIVEVERYLRKAVDRYAAGIVHGT